jgi:protoporphyrin/coproporphyrin ferrochelatase
VSRGALLMTYGSPASLERDDIATYLGRVRGGREPDDELIDEFTRRYRVIGGSPLIGITRAQAAAVSAELGWPVEIGMRFSEPSVERGLDALSERGVSEVAAIILSPQYSPLLMGGYARAIETARSTLGPAAPEVTVAGAWYEERAFIGALAARITMALGSLSQEEREATRVLMTAHSLPKRVAEQEPDYLAQLRETAEAVAQAAGLDEAAWTFCWQSAGHEPGEWMTPDFADLMPAVAADGGRGVLVSWLSGRIHILCHLAWI